MTRMKVYTKPANAIRGESHSKKNQYGYPRSPSRLASRQKDNLRCVLSDSTRPLVHRVRCFLIDLMSEGTSVQQEDQECMSLVLFVLLGHVSSHPENKLHILTNCLYAVTTCLNHSFTVEHAHGAYISINPSS